MKVFMVAVLVVALVSSQKLSEHEERVQRLRHECILETGVNPRLVEEADRGDFTDDKNLKCFAKCFYERAGFVNDRAELLLDAIKSKIPDDVDREKALDVIERCAGLVGADGCETVYLVHKCYYQGTHSQEKQA